MPDPVTLTASAITTLAFQEFIKSSAGELAKKFTGEAIAKMEQLRDLLWNRLTEKHPAAAEALTKAKAGEQEGIEKVAKFVDVELLDKDFAQQVQMIAQEINVLINEEGGMSQRNSGGTNFQNKIDGGEVYQGPNMTIHNHF